MQMILINTDGTSTNVTAETASDIEKILNAGMLDAVDLRDGHVMFVDDDGQAKRLPVNFKGTKLYHSVCRAGTTFQIRGDVVIAEMDYKPTNRALGLHAFRVPPSAKHASELIIK
jgi:hypothetical protein